MNNEKEVFREAAKNIAARWSYGDVQRDSDPALAINRIGNGYFVPSCLFLTVQTLTNRLAPTVQQGAADAVLTGRGRRTASPRKAFCDNPQLLIFRKSTPPSSVDHLKTAHPRPAVSFKNLHVGNCPYAWE